MPFQRLTPDNIAFTPAEQGMVAYTMQPEDGGTAQFHPGAGQVWLARGKLRATLATGSRSVGYQLQTLGNTLTNSFFGVYQNNGTNWTLMGAGSSDQSTALAGATGLKTCVVGNFGLTPTDIFIALVIGSATTLPKLSGSAAPAALVNDNWPNPALNSPVARFMSGGATLTALPATLDAAGITWGNALSFYARIT